MGINDTSKNSMLGERRLRKIEITVVRLYFLEAYLVLI